jgi:redox-sensitive bicupin YhaK (pirin superfamily)
MDRRQLLQAGAALTAGSVIGAGSVVAADSAWADAVADRGKKPGPKQVPRGPRLIVRRSGERGRGSHGGWLEAKYTFSFSRYWDPKHRGFRSLRVMNEDVIQESKGFRMHPHRDMEILTYVLEGALKHKDSLGNGGVIVPGTVQRMSAGAGIRHSEFNPSKRDDTHLMQIWLLPSRKGGRPGYAEKTLPGKGRKGALRLVASPSGAQGSITIGTNVNLYSALLAPRQKVAFTNRTGRHVWIQVARGSLTVNHVTLHQGDGLRTSDPGQLLLTGVTDAEILLFDLA